MKAFPAYFCSFLHRVHIPFPLTYLTYIINVAGGGECWRTGAAQHGQRLCAQRAEAGPIHHTLRVLTRRWRSVEFTTVFFIDMYIFFFSLSRDMKLCNAQCTLSLDHHCSWIVIVPGLSLSLDCIIVSGLLLSLDYHCPWIITVTRLSWSLDYHCPWIIIVPGLSFVPGLSLSLDYHCPWIIIVPGLSLSLDYHCPWIIIVPGLSKYLDYPRCLMIPNTLFGNVKFPSLFLSVSCQIIFCRSF
jgi:hypothetical protein